MEWIRDEIRYTVWDRGVHILEYGKHSWERDVNADRFHWIDSIHSRYTISTILLSARHDILPFPARKIVSNFLKLLINETKTRNRDSFFSLGGQNYSQNSILYEFSTFGSIPFPSSFLSKTGIPSPTFSSLAPFLPFSKTKRSKSTILSRFRSCLGHASDEKEYSIHRDKRALNESWGDVVSPILYSSRISSVESFSIRWTTVAQRRGNETKRRTAARVRLWSFLDGNRFRWRIARNRIGTDRISW